MIVGLTGGIGSGKSTVAKLLEILGCVVFSSDEAAKLCYYNDVVKEKIIDLLGEESYSQDSSINRKHISQKIFSDNSLLVKLNAIIHPQVGLLFEQFKNANHGKVIIKESALLFEARIAESMDKVIMVASRDELRIKRVMARDGLTHAEVQKKIENQMPQDEKIKLADFVIYNNEEQFLITQVISIFGQLKPFV